jgi:uncharacterized protein (TIGR03382 family)
MGYVQAGYSIVLAILFLYALALLWRRRRVTRTVQRVLASSSEIRSGGDDPGGVTR